MFMIFIVSRVLFLTALFPFLLADYIKSDAP